MDKPFPYQEIGSEFLASKRFALLADEMGLGKTVQAIRGLERIHAKRCLVICPSVARINWAREFKMWSLSNLNVQVVAKLGEKVQNDGHLICSFDYAVKNSSVLRDLGWDVMIVDEAHYLKSTEANRAKAILGATGIVRGAKRTWLLTGTPAPNHYGELWIMLYTFGVTKLTSDAFIREYCVVRPTTYGAKVVASNTAKSAELRELLSHIMLRRLKKDVMKELPPIHFGYVSVEPGLPDLEVLPSFAQYFLPTDKRHILKAELLRQQNLLETIETQMKSDRTDKLQVISAISDSVSTLRRYIGLQKCEAVIELVKRELQAKAYKKIVIFAIHSDVIMSLRNGLREFNAVTLYGNTPPEKRQKNIDKFQKNDYCRVFIGNIHAAGTAITLTAAHHVLFIEQDWVPGNNAQAIMRCHRIGQENPVTVRFVALEGSLDAKIAAIVKRKTMQLTQIFDIK